MILIDTNILVYAYDDFEKEKREKCSQILDGVFSGKIKACVSNQILAELFFVLTRNMKKPLDSETAQQIVDSIIGSEKWSKINYDYKTIKNAIELVKRFGVSIWDGVIAATMIENNVFTIYTENEKDFEKVRGIEAINPLNTQRLK